MKKIALVMGGGVSLGTYIAGVLTELLYALEHNESSEAVAVDVMAGASAGSMTAAMVAKALLYDKTVVSNLREAWVERIAWRRHNGRPGLRRTFSNDPDVPVLSLLNDEVIARIAGDILTAPTHGQAGRGVGGPSLRRVDMAFTLANLHGVPYEVPYQNAPTSPQGGFVSTIFSDWIEFSLGPAEHSTARALEEAWKVVRKAAMASGAFPFAFEPKEVERDIGDFGSRWLRRVLGGGAKELYYSDGGTFNNEPLRLAAKLARARDAEEPAGERFFLFIDPYLSDSPFKETFEREELSLLAYAKRLMTMFLSESSAKDFLRAHRYNTRLDWFEALLLSLGDMLDHLTEEQRRLGEETLTREVDQHLTEKLEADSEDTPSQQDVDDEREENLQRIEATYWETLGATDWAPSKQKLMGVLILVLELASGLRGKRPMKLYLLAPSGQQPLAGDFLMNFGGFFSQRYREADFRHGRVDCREFLNRHGAALGLRGGPDSSFDYKYDARLKNTTFTDLEQDEKDSFREWFEDAFNWALDRALTRWKVGSLKRKVTGFAAKKFIRPMVYKLLTERKAPPAKGSREGEVNSGGGKEA